MDTIKRPLLMGVLNVTPDSFSDGGVHFEASKAIDAGLRMVAEGADILDVGGESTRPGATPVSVETELARVLPVLDGLSKSGVRISIDTSKALVAREALAAGASIVNDVTALADPQMGTVCAAADCDVCLMHMRGDPSTMQLEPRYENVVAEVREFLLDRAAFAGKEGIATERIWIDPGIGFGKTANHNLLLLRHLGQFANAGYPVLIGVSRKSFIGRILGSSDEPLPSNQRLEGTLAAQVVAQLNGAQVIRSHDVLESRRALDVCAAIACAN